VVQGDLERILADALRAATAELPAYEQVRGCLLARGGFSVAGGHLTANLKLRRGAIERLYAADIERLYAALEETTRRGGDPSGVPVIRWAP
jgi:long-chain acyl-CoA synthetase